MQMVHWQSRIKSETVLSASFYLESNLNVGILLNFPRPQLLASDICFNFLEQPIFSGNLKVEFCRAVFIVLSPPSEIPSLKEGNDPHYFS